MPPLFNGVFSDLFRDPKWVVLWLPFNCKKVENIFSLLYDVGFSWKSIICELTNWRRLTDHPLWLSKLVGLFCLNVWSVLETRLQHVSGEILLSVWGWKTSHWLCWSARRTLHVGCHRSNVMTGTYVSGPIGAKIWTSLTA